jgi:arylsulfatase A-like enzyme
MDRIEIESESRSDFIGGLYSRFGNAGAPSATRRCVLALGSSAVTQTLLSKRWPWILAGTIAIAVYLSTFIQVNIPILSPESSGYSDPRPLGSIDDIRNFANRKDTNVLFVLIDTLRAERMGMYDYARDTTPFLDGIAESGVRFDRHLAQSSWTKCSMASLWTGLYPPRTGVIRFNHALPDDALMPAEIFEEAGYRTIGIYRNGWVSGYFGFEQGFDVYAKPSKRPIPPSIRRENPTLTSQGTDMDTVETAVEFLRLHGEERWMLYLHMMDVHEYLYDAESALFGTSNSDIYDNAILHEDYVMQTLFEELDRLNLTDKTLVVIASDHGEAFGERGVEGHAREVHRETTEVPFILSFPFRLDEGVVLSSRTANVDIWPTVLDLLGLPSLDPVDGRSLRDEILASGDPHTDDPQIPHFAYLDQAWGGAGPSRPTIAVTEGSLRYVLSRKKGRWVDFLFDSEGDPLEQVNLAGERAETVERLKTLALNHRDQTANWEEGVPELEIDEMELNQLRALGYAIP